MKVVVITGASRGLGTSLVQEFAQNNWQGIGTGRSDQPTDFPANAVYRQFDASSAEASEAFWGQLRDEHPDAEVCLINNAGGYVSGSLIDTTAESYEQQMRSIYFSAVYMTKSMATVIPKAKIVNIISSSALAAHKNDSAYGAAKAAEMHFFHSLQQEFKPGQYQIINLYPNDIATHGDNSAAIEPHDLARFVREQADNSTTYYLRDVTMYPAV